MQRIFLALVALLALSGCAASVPPQVFTPYSDGDFQAWTGHGPARIQGHAFYRMPNGRVLSCAGAAVTLLPATGYNLEAEQSIGMGHGLPENYSRSALKYARKTMCDGAGRFTFENLPSQTWIAMVHLSWQETATLPFMASNDRGGTLFQETTLEAGDNKIILTNQDFVADQ